ncbi:tripartite tricarboxylate transporter permease [Halomonas sp. MCCC 1A11036]|uniref:Tripartite tricarboxylate transporter permease n=1 Tax=Billgrantia zhangzhouensis TaxID=2733481 RepID=A0ABS9AI68_9GAMM|nr:tripartite tricarboxylate transporter permease [Halomonas zhangzhouensis]MCE8021463.1 tripartite tricarboxylate transporter permease [Halomonas zhangzhouensis]
MIENLLLGFSQALTVENLFYCFTGVFVGTFIGVLPGVGALAAVSLLLPVTFYLEPLSALIMLAGIFYGAEYGGSIAAILLNLPGTTSSAVVCLDGYPMAKNNRAGVALFVTAIASFIGGSIGIVLLIALTPTFIALALNFSAPEYFSVIVFGLIAASTISQGSQIKSIAMVLTGLGLGTVGMDVNTGIPRLTFGMRELYDGISIVAVAMGLFGVSEIIASVRYASRQHPRIKVSMRDMLPTWSETRRSVLPIMRGTSIGSLFGALPGTGATVASFISYAIEKRVSRHPERFGKGAVEGIAGPESSNNAAAQTAFIPTLTLGIPGTATMALILGAMMIHGITPGPSMISNEPVVFWGLIASFWIGNVFLLILNVPLIRFWVAVLQTPYRLLYPAVIGLICIGVYSINRSVFDVYLVFILGIMGYGMRLLNFQPAPLLLGFVLGPLLEENFRRALIISRGDYSIFFERPISAAVLVLSLGLLILALSSNIRQKYNAKTRTSGSG